MGLCVFFFVALIAFCNLDEGQTCFPTASPPPPPPQNCIEDGDYDFIIVGSGATGSVIANRLSELKDMKVLVLEAGDVPLHVSSIPLIAYKALHSEMDWNYRSTPQKNCCFAYKDEKVPLTRGKALGGTTTLNYMAATRCNRRDYDSWLAAGNDGWGYDDMLKYFLKLEAYDVPMRKEDEQYHNKSGQMPIQIPPFKSQMAGVFEKAAYELGLPLVDYNGDTQIGYMYPPVTMRDGERCSTYRGYLKPAMERKNLKVITRALVTKILFDENNTTAIGVTYETSDKKKCIVKVRREVIVCGGAYNSPQLLLLSGIGPKEELEKLNIPVIKDLPGVGKNLQDHVVAGGMMMILNQSVGLSRKNVETKENEDLWEKSKTGPMTVPIAFEGVSFHKTSVENGPSDWPDLEIYWNSDNILKTVKSYLKTFLQVLVLDDVFDIISLVPILLRPESRGTVTLQSADPYDPPLINPNYLSAPNDLKVMAEAVGLVHKSVNTKAFQLYGATLYAYGIIPNCIVQGFMGDQIYRECVAQTVTSTGYHPSSSCMMGPSNNSMAVVDNNLKVHGLKGLRVADASIMPTVVAGHPQIPCMAIGEKISDVIKAEIEASKKKK